MKGFSNDNVGNVVSRVTRVFPLVAHKLMLSRLNVVYLTQHGGHDAFREGIKLMYFFAAESIRCFPSLRDSRNAADFVSFCRWSVNVGGSLILLTFYLLVFFSIW